MTVVTVRSNSRNSGDTSCEHVTSSPLARNSSATASSADASRSASSRHTATPSTPSGTGMPTPTRLSRGTSGTGRCTRPSYSAGRFCRPISMTSSNPGSVTSANRAPRRSSNAFVATVVPCANSTGTPAVVSAESRPIGRDTADTSGGRLARAAATAAAGSAGVDSTLAMVPSGKTASVKVPPVSTPTRTGRSAIVRVEQPDLVLADRVLQRADLLADGGIGAVPNRDGLVRVTSEPCVAPGQSAAGLLLRRRRLRLQHHLAAGVVEQLAEPRPRRGGPHRVGLGIRQHGDKRNTCLPCRLGAQLLGAQPEPGQDDEVLVQLRLGPEDLGQAPAHALGHEVVVVAADARRPVAHDHQSPAGRQARVVRRAGGGDRASRQVGRTEVGRHPLALPPLLGAGRLH